MAWGLGSGLGSGGYRGGCHAVDLAIGHALLCSGEEVGKGSLRAPPLHLPEVMVEVVAHRVVHLKLHRLVLDDEGELEAGHARAHLVS